MTFTRVSLYRRFPCYCLLVWMSFAAASTAGTTTATPAAELQIIVDTEPKSEHYGRISVIGVDRAAVARFQQTNPGSQDWQQLFSVKLQSPSSATPVKELPNVAGRYEYLNTGFRFTPRFPPRRGLTCHVSINIDGYKRTTGSFLLDHGPSISTGNPRVKAVYPSTDTVPENLLRLYVHFSRPMRRGQAVQRIRLLDEKDEVIQRAFIIGPLGELWDHKQQRLTLLLDPGRIKRGVGPNRRIGPALLAGLERTVVVDGQFKDSEGRYIGAEFRKTYRIVPATRSSIQPYRWTTSPPSSDSRQPLYIRFSRTLDHGMLAHSITIHDADGAQLVGQVSIGAGERDWRFTPATPWKRAPCTIRVASRLEDISGNNVLAPLDVELNSNTSLTDRRLSKDHLEWQFTPVARSELHNH